eukprot:310957-Pleurochrysis_carterae.AAC.2
MFRRTPRAGGHSGLAHLAASRDPLTRARQSRCQIDSSVSFGFTATSAANYVSQRQTRTPRRNREDQRGKWETQRE